MMLTWKVFVIIMSLVTLTLVNVNSSGDQFSSGPPRPLGSRFITLDASEGSSSSGTRRRRRNSFVNLNPSGDSSSSDTLGPFTSNFTIYDLDSKHDFSFEYNLSNPFSKEESADRYECFKQLRMFCDFNTFDLKSHQCAKKGILLYKKTLLYKVGSKYYDFLDAVHTFFSTFKLSIRCVELPITFCERQAKDVADMCMMELINTQEFFIHFQQSIELLGNHCFEKAAGIEMDCREDLTDYQALVQDPINMNRPVVEAAKKVSREAIVNFALFEKTIIGLKLDGYEKIYLEHISNRITTGDEQHNPHNFCNNLQNLIIQPDPVQVRLRLS